MKFCPDCGKPVHLTSTITSEVILADERRIQFEYACPDDRHRWQELIDPYGGYTIFREAI